MKKKTAALFALVLVLAFESAVAVPFAWNFHDLLYVSSNKQLALNKTLPKDNIRVFNFEKPVHVYMKITITCRGEKYESAIIPFYKKAANDSNSHLLNPADAGIKEIIADVVKKNNLPMVADMYIDIDLVSRDFENDFISIDFSHNDICIRNLRVPDDIPPLFK